MLCADFVMLGNKDVYIPMLSQIADLKKAATCKLRLNIFCVYGSGHEQSQQDMTTPRCDSDSIVAATTNVQVWGTTQPLLTAWTVHHCQERAGFCR